MSALAGVAAEAVWLFVRLLAVMSAGYGLFVLVGLAWLRWFDRG